MEGRRFRAHGYCVGAHAVAREPGDPGGLTTLDYSGGPCFCGASSNDDAARTAAVRDHRGTTRSRAISAKAVYCRRSAAGIHTGMEVYYRALAHETTDM